MSVEQEMDDEPLWRRAVLAVVVVVAPFAIGTALLFGGGQVSRCLALYGCGMPPPPALFTVIGPTEILLLALAAVAMVWLIAVLLTIRYLWSADRSRLKRSMIAISVLAVTTSGVVVLTRLLEHQRLRTVVMDSALLGVGAAIIAIPFVLAWAILTIRRRPARP